MHGRTIDRLAVLEDRIVIGGRNRFAMGDQIADHRPAFRGPGTDLRRAARLAQIDRRLAADLVLSAEFRHALFMTAPAKFCRLTAFADKAIDRPGVAEFAGALG